jgi:hypothetical protein
MRHSSVPVWANPNNRDWKSVVMAKAERGYFDRQRVTRRSSLIKLASTAFDLHISATAKGVTPRDDDDGSQPLAVALAALATANKRENSR